MHADIMQTLILAVAAERERIEDPKNRTRYFVYGKSEEGSDDEGYWLTFRNAPARVLRDAGWQKASDGEALFRVGDRFVPANMWPVGGALRIFFRHDALRRAELDLPGVRALTQTGIDYVMDARELMEYLLAFLEMNTDESNPFLSSLFMTENADPVDPLITRLAYYDLNDSQKDAVSKAVRQRTTFVWGPPGTGKTRTLAALAANLIKQRRSVLLTAMSNNALDQLLSATLALLEQDRVNVAAARLGGTMDDSLRGYGKSAFGEGGFASDRAGESWPEHVGNASLVAANFTYLTLPYGCHPDRCDMVVADEVSMANIPSIAAVSFYAKHGFVVGGDPYQLPPIYPEDADEPNEYFQSNIFERAGVTDTADLRAAFLDTQYRMQKPIGDLVSDLFYESLGGLHTGTPASGSRADRIVFIHCRGIVESIDDAFSPERRFNTLHAGVIARVVIRLLEQDVPPSDIGIIAPYNAQVVKISDRLRGSIGIRKAAGIKVSTVHSFQGQERDVIVVDFTDSNVPPTPLTAKRQLINVALSRAKEYLILIGNRDYLTSERYFQPEDIRLFEKLLVHCRIVDEDELE